MWTLPAVDESLRRATEAGEVPGLVVAAATDDGLVYEAAFGKREVGKPAAMTTDSVFWIASMTKAITCTAAMQLVERGKLKLDDPIETLLPQLAGRQVLEVDPSSGDARLRPAKRAITLRQL
ncbi:MAG: beta-lactamase family protein, partial [Hyphomicrobiales bacterium]|nr:beta-lactamase family protein [Hyphomicrobiales bacterium]